jgi:uncharacterized protein
LSVAPIFIYLKEAKMEMKESKYNYYIPFGNDYIFFNGIRKKFMVVPQENKELAIKLIVNPALCEKLSPIFFTKIRRAGLIVDKNTDEINIIRAGHSKYKGSQHYLLTILPTYACNFSCWYCIQHHREEVMTPKMQEVVKKHICQYLLNNKIKLFELAWFGGEPLLCFSIIKNISAFAQKFCKDHNIRFANGITTNGYFITEENAKEMRNLEFVGYQITIDGVREEHDQTRNNSGCPSFDIILKNICMLCDIIPNAKITLRFNYSNKNIKPLQIINEVNSIIPKHHRGRILILPRKLWQVPAEHNHDRVNLINQLIDGFRNAGYQAYPIDISMNFSGCYVNKEHYNAIYPNGSVGKCTTKDIDEVQGRLTCDGDIEWTENYLENKINIPFFENKMCLSCKHLPICMGPCPQDNGNVKIDLNKLKCSQSIVDTTFEDDVLHYCTDIIYRQKL